MCFDTTSSNTGPNKGACALLEKHLKRELLPLSCRHHTSEIIISNVFKVCMNETSTSPDVNFFSNFEKTWELIDKSKPLNSLTDDSVLANISNQERLEIINFIRKTLSLNKQPRRDYKEFLQLCGSFLGDETIKIKFRKPGSLSRARWMNRVIYSLKMYHFRHHIQLTPQELQGVTRICIFVVKFYIKLWFQTHSAPICPNLDLEFIKKVKKFENTDEEVAQAALKKISTHNYLTEQLICLAFFDENVSNKIKKLMAKRILGKSSLRQKTAEDLVLNSSADRLTLASFVTPASLKFFTVMKVDPTFLSKSVGQWPNDHNYNILKQQCENLQIVNDVAERGVALATKFASSITKNKNNKQNLLISVAQHRKSVDSEKKNLLKYYQNKS